MSIFNSFRENQTLKLYDLPPLVKQAKDEAFTPPQKLGAFFADPIALEYPCHNAPSTILSTALVLQERRDDPRFNSYMSKLAECANHFGVRKEYDNIVAKDKEIRDTDLLKLADSDFALVVDIDGAKVRQYPIRNPAEVKAAAEYLKRNRTNFKFEDRNKIARRILAKAQEFDLAEVQNDEIILKTAGIALVNGKSLGDVLRKLAALVPAADREKAIKRAEDFDKKTLIDNESAVKAASVVEDFYQQFGILSDPVEDNIFIVTKNDLEQVKQSFVAFGGEFFKREDLNKLGQETAVGLIGDRAKCLFSVLPIKPTADDPKMASLLATSLKTAGIV